MLHEWIKEHADGVVIGGALASLAVWASRAWSIASGARKAWAWVMMFFGGAQRVLDRLDSQDATLAAIRAELTPNGGGSLKDIVRKTHDLAMIAELRTKQILATSPVGVYQCDRDGNCIWVNDALCSIFGLDSAAMMGRGWLLAVADDEREESNGHWQRAVDQDLPYSWTYTIENQRTRRAARYRTTVAVLRRPDTGEPLLYHGTVEPVADERPHDA